MSKPEKREKVLGITINVLGTDGVCRTLTIDPDLCEAIFWTDRAVNEILAPFYDRIDKTTTREELVSRFGEAIEPALAKLGIMGSEVKITSELVKEMWQLEHNKGDKISYILKTRKCIPRPCKG
jgi:hypothetical protein